MNPAPTSKTTNIARQFAALFCSAPIGIIAGMTFRWEVGLIVVSFHAILLEIKSVLIEILKSK